MLPMFWAGVAVTAWVAVMNPDGVRNGNNEFPFGESCLVEFPLATRRQRMVDGQTLYRIETVKETAYGSLCPRGTLFLMEEAVYAAHETQAHHAQERQQRLRERIRDLLTP